MRLIKAQSTNLRSIAGKGVKYDVNDIVQMDSDKAMLVPKGTSAERPSSAADGYIRYNTDDNRFEAYENGAWVGVRSTVPSTTSPITVQTVGYGDAVETFFGPLDSGDPFVPAPVAAQNILVFVENVYQLPTTNYSLTQNPGDRKEIATVVSVGSTTVIQTETNHGYTTDDLLYVSGVESNIDDIIESLNTDDSSSPSVHTIVSIPAANQIEVGVDTTGGNLANYVAGTGFILKAGSSTGPYLPGWYLEFTSAPDLDKPITVIHNFDK